MPLIGVKKPSKSALVQGLILLVVSASLLMACGTGQPAYPPQPGNEEPPGFFPTTPVTEQGVATQNLYSITFWIAVIVFVLVEGLLIWITLRFRRKPTDTELPPQIHGNNKFEFLWTIIPAITVTILFIGALITLTEKFQVSAAEPDLVVDVTAFQWQWQFDYEDEGLSFSGSGRTGPTLVLPTNETVRIRLHAAPSDVIHSFYVPQFLYKLDVVPGRVNEFEVNITREGTFGGQCAEFCGIGHADMQFQVQAMSRADFDAWVVEQQNAIPTPAPSAPPDAPQVNVTSIGVTEGFDPGALTAPANTPWVVNLTNADPAVPHDFAITGGNPDGTDWLGDPDAPGGGSAVYQPPPLAPGTYEFFCSIHPNMVGTLNVGQ